MPCYDPNKHNTDDKARIKERLNTEFSESELKIVTKLIKKET